MDEVIKEKIERKPQEQITLNLDSFNRFRGGYQVPANSCEEQFYLEEFSFTEHSLVRFNFTKA